MTDTLTSELFRQQERTFMLLCVACNTFSRWWERGDLLGHVEGESKVSSSIFRIESGVVERFRVEVVDESTERHAVGPARRKVGDVYMLPPKK